MSAKQPVETTTLVLACLPTSNAVAELLREIRLWNAVTGLPRIEARSSSQYGRVRLSSVISARRGIARLVEALGGIAVDETGDPSAMDGVFNAATERTEQIRENVHGERPGSSVT